MYHFLDIGAGSTGVLDSGVGGGLYLFFDHIKTKGLDRVKEMDHLGVRYMEALFSWAMSLCGLTGMRRFIQNRDILSYGWGIRVASCYQLI